MSAEAGTTWLGGSPRAGKSTVAGILARRYGLDVYRVDEAFEDHARRLDLRRQPALVRWLAASATERWLRPVDDLVNDAIACYREHLGLVLEDVSARTRVRPLLVEGTALLPTRSPTRSPRPAYDGHHHGTRVLPVAGRLP